MFSDMLRYLRKREGLSQAELAEKLNIKRSTVSSYEQGTREPNFEMLECIADYFNVNMSTLIGDDGVPMQFNPHYAELTQENKALVDSLIAQLLKSQS